MRVSQRDVYIIRVNQQDADITCNNQEDSGTMRVNHEDADVICVNRDSSRIGRDLLRFAWSLAQVAVCHDHRIRE
jgi:hypothetical protein